MLDQDKVGRPTGPAERLDQATPKGITAKGPIGEPCGGERLQVLPWHEAASVHTLGVGLKVVVTNPLGLGEAGKFLLGHG